MTENANTLIIDFNKQLRGKEKPTAAEIADAWSASADVLNADLADYVYSFAKQQGHDKALELAAVKDATTAGMKAAADAKQKEKQKETAAAYSAALESGEPEKIKAALSELNKTGAASGRERIATYESFVNELKKYEPENDFKPSLFAGLSCPNGTMSIIGARPAGGKTSAMINITREALSTDRAAFFVNLEMNSRQILTNLCLSIMYESANGTERTELKSIEKTIGEFNRPFKWVNNGQWQKNETFARLQLSAMNKIKDAMATKKLFIYDAIGNTLEGITADIAYNVKEGDIVLLDYMQRAPAPLADTKQQRYIQIQQVSQQLLNTAIQSQAVIIAGAQFKRGENETDKATLASFREGGDIEQDAHNALAIENSGEYTHVLKAREGGANYECMTLETIKQYVFWTGAGEYKKAKESVKKKKETKKSNKHNYEL
ncbi:hypothetical protein FACS189494_09300 [Spirochaetia bacterium]|nr:hypothetical protein FACS189494_09300 [Spirochaetia bacterium]